MTDHPRFQSLRSHPDREHRRHHGAAQVDLVFMLADWWCNRTQRAALRETKSLPAIGGATTTTVKSSPYLNLMRRSA